MIGENAIWKNKIGKIFYCDELDEEGREKVEKILTDSAEERKKEEGG